VSAGKLKGARQAYESFPAELAEVTTNVLRAARDSPLRRRPRSLVSQGVHRIDRSRAPRRSKTRHDGNGNQQHGHTPKD
jgi:hypothetical protein